MVETNNQKKINLPVSPVTGSKNVKVEHELSSAKIIELYKHDYNIDVHNYFEDLECIQIYKCLDTGFRFYFPYSLAGSSELYKSLDHEHPDYYSLRLEHHLVDNYFKEGKKVLEVGCGSGFFLKSLQGKGLECIGLEFNEDAVQFALNQGLSVLSQDLIDHSQSNLGKYDIVCSFQVLEHVVDIAGFLRACIASLKIGGKLIIVVPNNNPFLYKYDEYHTLNLPPHHMGLWDEMSFRNLSNFFPISLDRFFVEPLQKRDYAYYLQLHIKNLKHRIGLLSVLVEFLLLKMRPFRARSYLQKIICHSLPGRNITAIYTKQ
jgi:SAM-dependent methyltransferase